MCLCLNGRNYDLVHVSITLVEFVSNMRTWAVRFNDYVCPSFDKSRRHGYFKRSRDTPKVSNNFWCEIQTRFIQCTIVSCWFMRS